MTKDFGWPNSSGTFQRYSSRRSLHDDVTLKFTHIYLEAILFHQSQHIYFICGNVTTKWLMFCLSVCLSICFSSLALPFSLFMWVLSGKHSHLPSEHSSLFETANTWYKILELRCEYLATHHTALTMMMSHAMALMSTKISHTGLFRLDDIITVWWITHCVSASEMV